MTPHEKHRRIVDITVRIEAAQKELRQLESEPTSTPCELCEHLQGNFCSVWNMDVPVDYRNQDSCEAFEDAIPF
ncbi:MAG TPA: hypothetical protein PLB10_19125 [Thiolinea sp.]|nr:hypothetical protein [Thiolinea sp.]